MRVISSIFKFLVLSFALFSFKDLSNRYQCTTKHLWHETVFEEFGFVRQTDLGVNVKVNAMDLTVKGASTLPFLFVGKTVIDSSEHTLFSAPRHWSFGHPHYVVNRSFNRY